MKYKSNLTKPIKMMFPFFFLFWVGNFFAILNSNGIQDTIGFSVFMCIFIFLYTFFLIRGIYIIVEDNNVRYVHMFTMRKTVEIGKIKKIKKGKFWGYYSALSLVCEDGGSTKEVNIGVLTFKKSTLKQFVSDLKAKNSNIVVDKSVNELVS